MSGFLSSSIGKKLIMSISGLFLILFLVVHLTVNLLLLLGSEAYNTAAHFMGTNPLITSIQPILALGFLVHIVYAFILTAVNAKARPVKYEQVSQSHSSSLVSRQMLPLGLALLLFLVLHMIHFFVKLKVTGEAPMIVMEDGVEMHNTYLLVGSLFQMPLYAIMYIFAAIFLAMHLSHGFWSAFQTIGWSNEVWRGRLTWVGYAVAGLFGFGYAIVPLYFLIFQPITL